MQKKPKLPSPLYVRIKNRFPSITTQQAIIIERKQENVPPWHIITPNVDTTLADCNKKLISNHEHKTKFLELNNKYSSCKKLYTDAYKSNQGVRYAMIADNNVIQKRLPIQTSILTAEAYAVHDALKYIYTFDSQDHVIYTGSMSVIKTLTNTAKRNKNEIIRNVLIPYTELASTNKKIFIVWIPSHQGISGNRQADFKAKEATTLQTEHQQTPIPIQEIIQHEKKKINEEQNNIWKSKPSKIHNIITNFFQNIPRNLMSRKEKIVLSRLRTGHSKITHEHIIKKTDPPFCCETPLTVHHLLYDCQKFSTQRRKFRIYPSTALTTKEHIRNTIQFLNETKLFHKI
ncbi:uncharacterized protein LOC128889223 [Hylaeus anthracinus]|uniref:uncharacterized protein LOC128889223 n=1 Tax=Hylaeus anthracinus TaxID=313031 RepID=UPI0023B9CCD9|nr:uncharacterized protein LOC128889223 [Hylaeus anthracinus]